MAPVAWGQTSDDIANRLWRDPKWLNLGHYEKTWFGYRSPFQGIFFIDPKGDRDPHRELKATLDAFLNPPTPLVEKLKMHPQCFFGARFKWLKSKMPFRPDQIQNCPERTEWKKRLNATSVSAIFAASDMNSGPSSFGHLFLKLRNPENTKSKELIDYGVNYAADADRNEGIFYAVKGIFGLYGGRFTMLPFHQKIREYTNVEGRDLWEYPLNFSTEETDELIDHLLELDQAQAPYHFFSNNCSYQIARALEAVRPSLRISKNLPAWVIPLDVLKEMAREPYLLIPPTFHRSLKSDYLESLRHLDSNGLKALEEVNRTLKVPENSSLENNDKAAVLDAAMKFYALKSYQTHQDLDQEKYRLSVARARLGVASTDHISTTPTPPDQSHDSGGVSLGRGWSKAGGHYQSLKLRQAFHEITQEDSGAVKFSHIESLSYNFRYYDSGRASLADFTLLNLLNTSPITHLDRPFSWRAHLGVEDQFQTRAQGGIGASQDLSSRFRITQLLFASQRRSETGGGVNVVLVGRPFQDLGILADGSYIWTTTSIRRWNLRAQLDYQLSKNWDFVIEHENQSFTEGKILYSFLF